MFFLSSHKILKKYFQNEKFHTIWYFSASYLQDLEAIIFKRKFRIRISSWIVLFAALILFQESHLSSLNYRFHKPKRTCIGSFQRECRSHFGLILIKTAQGQSKRIEAQGTRNPPSKKIGILFPRSKECSIQRDIIGAKNHLACRANNHLV